MRSASLTLPYLEPRDDDDADDDDDGDYDFFMPFWGGPVEQATQSIHRSGIWCGGEIIGGSVLNMDQEQGMDNLQTARDRRRACRVANRAVTETEGRCGNKKRESTLHVVLHLPSNTAATAAATAR